MNSILFTSSGKRTSLISAFRSAISQHPAYESAQIIALDASPYAPTLHGSAKACLGPRLQDERYPDFLLDLCLREGVTAVIPCIDPDIPLLAGLRDRFLTHAITLVVSDADIATICNDKSLTYTFFRDGGFRVAPFWVDRGAIPKGRFPLFIKPRCGSAIKAAQMGWRCVLVLHGTAEQEHRPCANYLLVRLTGAETHVVNPAQVHSQMVSAESALTQEGYRVCVIPGGGHSVRGSMAYYHAAVELAEQCRPLGWRPDYIVLASGTGTTQSGLAAGIETLGWDTTIIGVSIARRNPRGQNIVERAYHRLRDCLRLAGKPVPIDFLDDWVGEGYGRATPRVWRGIHLLARREGVLLDPTYTGKAFAGLLDCVANGSIPRGAKVLFWHTGGLLNLLASEETLDWKTTS